MVQKIDVFQLQQIAKLDGLSQRAVQAINFNNNTDFYEYALQYIKSAQTINIYKSDNNDGGSWDTTSENSNFSINFNKLITLDGQLGGHTQTLIQDGGNVITGMRHISFKNLETFLNMTTSQQKAKFLSSSIDNTSWTTLKKYLDGSLSNTNDSGLNWATNFIGLRNEFLNTEPIDGSYVNIIGADQLIHNVLRSELAVSENNAITLLAINDKDDGLHLFAYNLDMLSQVDNIHSAIFAYLDEYGFKTLPNPADLIFQYNPSEISNVLACYKDLLDNDCLVFDLSQNTPINQMSFTKQEVLQLTQVLNKDFSYQGFSVDSKGNVYISSGFGPDSKTTMGNPHVYVINNNQWYDIDCSQVIVQAGANHFPEIEGIQVLDPDNILVCVSIHDLETTGSTVISNKVYRLSWGNWIEND